MAHTGASTLPKGVIEHDRMLWKPNSGATATAEEFIAARKLFIELNTDSRWNPWAREDRAADIDAAQAIMEQWERAEPGHHTLTDEEFEVWMAEREHAREQRRPSGTQSVRGVKHITTSNGRTLGWPA